MRFWLKREIRTSRLCHPSEWGKSRYWTVPNTSLDDINKWLACLYVFSLVLGCLIYVLWYLVVLIIVLVCLTIWICKELSNRKVTIMHLLPQSYLQISMNKTTSYTSVVLSIPWTFFGRGNIIVIIMMNPLV